MGVGLPWSDKTIIRLDPTRDKQPRRVWHGLQCSQAVLSLGGGYAPLRIPLPRLPENILEDPGATRLRRGWDCVSALRKPQRRAAPVGLLRHHPIRRVRDN